MNIKKILIGLFVFGFVFTFSAKMADAAILDDILAEIKSLRAEIFALKFQQSANVLGAVSLSSVVCNPGQKIGDVNGDGLIDRKDVDLVSKIMMGTVPQPSNICCVDINKDGQISVLDIIAITNIINGVNQSPGICPVHCQTGQIIGDANNDGVIDSRDIDILRRVIISGYSPNDFCCIDVNEDGQINLLDITMLTNIISGTIQSPGTCHNLIPTSVACRPNQKIGDVNWDGLINYRDRSIVSFIISGSFPAPKDICCVDINKDKQINVLDIIAINNIINGVSQSPGTCVGLIPPPLTIPIVSCNPGQIIGDVNGDKLVNSKDRRLILGIINGNPTPKDICCVDVNRDKQVNVLDIIAINNIINGVNQSPGTCPTN